MKITFVCRGHESLGIETLSSYAKQQGIEVSLVFDPSLFDAHYGHISFFNSIVSYKQKVIDEVLSSGADLIAFSVFLEDYQWASSIAEEVKKKRKDILIIFGGIYPSSVPEYLIKKSFIDFVCVGEGEAALVELIKAISKNLDTTNIPNICAKKDGAVFNNSPRDLIGDLDALPFADKELFYNKYPGFSSTYKIQTGRGCPYDCSYCATSVMKKVVKAKGPDVRRRSVSGVIEELRAAKNKYDMKRVFFVDDLFAYDVRWIKDFLNEYKKYINLPFVCSIMPFFKKENKEIISLIKEFNNVEIEMGVQSIYSKQREEVLYRFGENEEIQQIIREFEGTSISLHVELLVGVPGQTAAELYYTARFFNRYRPNVIDVNWIRYYPCAAICDIALKRGDITQKEYEEYQKGKILSINEFMANKKNRVLAKLANLVTISHIIPRWMLEIIIKLKIYKVFPVSVPHKAFMLFRNIYVFLFKKGKNFGSISFCGVFKFYIHFIKNRASKTAI